MTARQPTPPPGQEFELTSSSNPLLPTHANSSTSRPYNLPSLSLPLPRRLLSRPRILVVLGFLLLVLLFNKTRLGTFRRDFVYLIRPLWDTPEPPWIIIDHYPPPTTPRKTKDVEQWCELHGWWPRDFGSRPQVVDAVLVNNELDMLEIRMKEYMPHVSTFVIVEANMTFSGQPKPTYFADNRARFDKLVAGHSKIIYHMVDDLEGGHEAGSFENEYNMRMVVSSILSSLELPEETLVIQSDVDEIISRNTLDLLQSCSGYPYNLHLNVANYRYSFQYPIPDDGYWRPHVYTTDASGLVGYHHSRDGDVMLADAGWHCSFCFPTLNDMRMKMKGYSHNDRVRDPRIMREKSLRGRVCRGEDPFDMYPEAFTFKDLVAQSGALKPSHSFQNIPVAVKDEPDRFAYLLEDGCERPDH